MRHSGSTRVLECCRSNVNMTISSPLPGRKIEDNTNSPTKNCPNPTQLTVLVSDCHVNSRNGTATECHARMLITLWGSKLLSAYSTNQTKLEAGSRACQVPQPLPRALMMEKLEAAVSTLHRSPHGRRVSVEWPHRLCSTVGFTCP